MSTRKSSSTFNMDSLSKHSNRMSPSASNMDPLSEDYGLEKLCLTEFQQSKFAITCEGYFRLVDCEYSTRCSVDQDFEQYISKSMYRYAMMIQLYGRLAFLRSGTSNVDGDQLVSYLRSQKFKIPRSIDLYLNGIGSLRDDATGKNYVLEFPAWPTSNGDFGRVTFETHWKYMSMPAPRVVALAIMKDFGYTLRDNAESWDLPEELVPHGKFGDIPPMPTANLLGWKLASSLTPEQCDTLKNLGIKSNSFGASGTFYLNCALFEHINQRLMETSKYARLVDANLFESENGSMAQLIYFQRDENEPETYNRFRQYNEAKLRGVSSQVLDSTIVTTAHIFNYRVEKLSIKCTNQSLHSWCIYDYDEYKNVPQNWTKSCNYILEYGNMKEVISPFCTLFRSKERNRVDLIHTTNAL